MLPFAWAIPHVGVLLWCWVAFMTPHQLVWGLSSSFRLNLMIAVATVLGWLFAKKEKFLQTNVTFFLIICIALHATLSTIFSLVPEISWPLWNRHIKTFVLIIFIMSIMINRVRVHALVWVIAISIGYFSVQGGGIGIVTLGGGKVVGPPNSQIADNNHLALAMVITLPIMNYLRVNSGNLLVKYTLLFTMGLSLIAVLLTYSRGGLISLCAMLVFLWLKSRNKIAIAIIVGIVGVPVVQFMPEKWINRMETIKTASDEDSSFLARLRSWETSFNLSNARPFLGGGFSSTQAPEVYTRYRSSDDPSNARAAHSIYFQVLGDLGYVGFALYWTLFIVGWFNARMIISLAGSTPALRWAEDLASMIQVSMIGFVVGGAALSMAYYDMIIALLAILECLKRQVLANVRSADLSANRMAPSQARANADGY